MARSTMGDGTATGAAQGTQEPQPAHGLRRRGIIAGAAALAAGLLAREAADPQRVAATSGTGPDGLLVLGSDGITYAANTTSHRTLIQPAAGFRGAGVFEGYAGVLSDADIAANSGGVDGVRGGGAGTASGVYGIGGGTGGTGVYAQGGAQGTAMWPGTGVVGLAAGATYYPPGTQQSAGVYGVGRGASAYGVRADSDYNFGVYATSDTNNAVFASTFNSTFAAAVQGQGQRLGMYGSATGTGVTAGNSYGVYGTSVGDLTHVGVGGNATAGRGVYGVATTGYGVYGQTSGPGSGPAVYGTSASGIGVYGISGGGGSPFGVVGNVTSAPGFGLYGVASVSGTVGFNAGASVAGAIAGQFSGPVNIYNAPATGTPITTGDLYVQRNFQVSGTKSAAVPHPDGTHRLLYCVESPEAWFEDFGEGTITAGKADVKLDPDFAAVVDTTKLHVFFTEHDTHHALTLTGRSATGFTVTADAAALTARGKTAADVNGTFTYRVVAKRKDVAAERLAKFTVPQAINAPALPAPVIPPAPQPPAPQTPPGNGGKKG